MIQLPTIFSSGGLYQHSAVIDLRGTADEKVCAQIQLEDGSIFSKGESDVDGEGCFSLTIETPPASLNRCRIWLWEKDSEESPLILEDILFGELWLASGQSNMNIMNKFMPEHEEFLRSIAELPLRVYYQNQISNKSDAREEFARNMPMEPTDGLNGVWMKADDTELMKEVSAVGTSYILKLYQLYKENGQEIPVGLVHCCVGAVRIEGWLPLEDIDEDDETAIGILARPNPETFNTFNTHDTMNYQQATVLFNLKVYPLRGLKFNGIIWYQGEGNVGRLNCEARYKRYLERYYNTYYKMFACGEKFRIVMSLLSPISCGDSGGCKIACINKAIAETAWEHHDKFLAVPNYDLSPVWGYEPFMHPGHTYSKYPLGIRMAQAYFNEVTAPTLREVHKDGQRLLLTFDNLGGALKIAGKRLYGLYLRGENTEYLEAEGECIDDETLAVWHPYITEPAYAAYQCASMSCDGNLYGKHLPVAPFSMEDPWIMHIEGKPWLHTENTSVWLWNCDPKISIDGAIDCFSHPIWQPVGESEVCTDPVFYRNIASLHISGETNIFGVFTKSRPYNRLDLQKYAGLRFWLFNAEAVSNEEGSVHAEFFLSSTEGRRYVIKRQAVRICEPVQGWAEFFVAFDEIPEDTIERFALMFDVGGCMFHFVNLDCLELIPKD